jgi:hypothetical protein
VRQGAGEREREGVQETRADLHLLAQHPHTNILVSRVWCRLNKLLQHNRAAQPSGPARDGGRELELRPASATGRTQWRRRPKQNTKGSYRKFGGFSLTGRLDPFILKEL